MFGQKEWKVIILSGVLLLTFIGIAVALSNDFYGKMVKQEVDNSSRLAPHCEEYGGTWVDEYDECEYISKEWCDNFDDAVYNECGSACRHEEEELGEPVPCTRQCVPYCSFE